MKKKIWVAVFLGLLFFVLTIQSSFAQGQAPTAMPTPNPTITVLEQKISNLEVDIAVLKDKKDTDKQSLQNEIDRALIPIYIWASILSALGISTAIGLFAWAKNWVEKTKKHVEDETRQKLDNAFFKADPRNFPVYFPKRNFETEQKNLGKLGFKSLRPYEFLPEVGERGIVIYHIPGENFDRDEKAKKHMLQELDDLKSFVKENQNKPLAYVIYIKGQPREVGDFIASAGNVASANMPVTIAGHIYTLARGLMD